MAVLCRLLEWVINLMDKEELFVKRIRELANLAYQRDITIEDHTASFFCLRQMTDFFLENLCRVRHTTVVASKIEDPGDLPRPELKPVSGTCASVRLDSLIALAFGTSRSSIVHCIEEGLVFVNGKLITSNGYEPKEGDIISVRKKGRFIYDGVSRQTKKGRLGVRILLYI